MSDRTPSLDNRDALPGPKTYMNSHLWGQTKKDQYRIKKKEDEWHKMVKAQEAMKEAFLWSTDASA